MKAIAGLAVLFGLVAIGCEGSGNSGPVAANPYEDGPDQRRQFSPASPAPGSRPKASNSPSSVPVAPARPKTGAQSAPRRPARSAKPAAVRDAGEYAVQLTLTEYSRMARRSSEMLKELTEIHIAVDESGDAGPYQDRWGELTADLTRLHREVMESGYPPADIALHLRESWLPLLEDAIAEAAQAIEEQTSVESGFTICQAQAEAIHAHLKQARKD